MVILSLIFGQCHNQKDVTHSEVGLVSKGSISFDGTNMEISRTRDLF